jgi:tetratricopeptide (TPR) repeat protein
MSVLVLASIATSILYYNSRNSAVDPRVVEARELYGKYNTYTETADMDAVFQLMDSIESVYSGIPHYSESYEIGVLSNNRGAAWLTLALQDERMDSNRKDSLLVLAETEILRSIALYEAWQTRFDTLSEEEIMEQIRTEFLSGLGAYPEEQQLKFLENRVSEIADSQTEVRRRMSVSYTNLGIILRHHEDYNAAMQSYRKALELWDRNLTAENNLNILLNKPLKKRNVIQRMFPPDRL